MSQGTESAKTETGSRTVDRRGEPAIVIMSVQDFVRTAAPPPDCGVECLQLPLLVDVSDWGEFPGRGTLLDVAPGPADRFIEPSYGAGVESENRRHSELSEFVGRAIPPLLAGEDSVPRAGA